MHALHGEINQESADVTQDCRTAGRYELEQPHCGMHAGREKSFACMWVLKSSVGLEGIDVIRREVRRTGAAKEGRNTNKDKAQTTQTPVHWHHSQMKLWAPPQNHESTHASSRVTPTSTAALHAPQMHLPSTTATGAIIRVLAVNATMRSTGGPTCFKLHRTKCITYRTPGNYWAGQIKFGLSKNGHANSVDAVQFRVVAIGCGSKAFASFVLFRNDVVQIKLNALLRRSPVNSSLGCFFGCTMPRRTVQHYHVCTRTPCWRETCVRRLHAAWGVTICRSSLPFARRCRVAVWFGFVGAALVTQE